jgi:hypothetical protein
MGKAEFNDLRLRKYKILSEYYKEERQRRAKVDAELAKIDEKLALLAKASLTLPCLVRNTPGPGQTVYHSADATCGRVRDRRNYTECSEHDALEEVGDWDYYLQPCSACDWDRAAEIHGQRG